jgi:hypothetical protein
MGRRRRAGRARSCAWFDYRCGLISLLIVVGVIATDNWNPYYAGNILTEVLTYEG